MGKILSGNTRSGTRSEASKNSVKTSSLVTVELRPEATGEGGGARKSTVISGIGVNGDCINTVSVLFLFERNEKGFGGKVKW